MSKKWYNLFVSVDQGQPGAEAPSEGNLAASNPAQTIAEIAAAAAPPPAFRQPVADPTSFDQIYEAAEIHPPAHGFTIFKIADMLKSEHIRSLPVEIKRSSVLLALDAAGVKLQDVLQDAVRRDQALDTFEAVQQRSLEQLESRKSEENQKLQEEADRVLKELRTRIQANNDEVEKERERLHTWRLQKHQEEQRIADAVAPFVSENPITTGVAAPSPRQSEPKPGQ